MTKASQPARLYVKMNEAAAMFGVGRSALYLMSQRKEIRIYKFGGASILKISEIEDLIKSRVMQHDVPGGLAGGPEHTNTTRGV